MNYKKTKEELLFELEGDPRGLSNDQVIASRQKHGKNELPEPKKDGIIKKFFTQLKDPLIIVLIIAAAVSIAIEPEEWIESLIIMVVVLFNAIIGVVEESNAEKSLEALQKLSSPTAKVMRNGEKVIIPSNEVVVGDIVTIEAGDYIPSDGRVIESFNLKVDESALTGESVPVDKIEDVLDKDDLALGDQKNMVFASTVCTYGRGTILVTSVGIKNEVGKIAEMLMSAKQEQTPLQIKLAQISKIIGFMCIGICAVVFALNVYTGEGLLEAFKTAVTLAVAAVPEGLATVVTIVLAIGVSKMVKQNAIVRKLPAVETLGSCSIICSDKTGTLTQNRMTVTKTYTATSGITDFNLEVSDEIRQMLAYFTLCSDGEVKAYDGKTDLIGDPTETALVYASYLLKDEKPALETKYPRVHEYSFDSDRKMMSVFVEHEGKILQITKGAPDIIISKSTNEGQDFIDANEQMANQALRVLAVAIKTYDSKDAIPSVEEAENNMTILGLVGMIDPPRLEVKDAIAQAKHGGIKTVMITGDHLATAKAIARDLGIYEDGHLAITGQELMLMSDEELDDKIENIRVYARVAPEHKVRIVQAWQRKDQVVAMTGDGVNDSPALKIADIGCAMGITGTDVSKQAADMILTDDNFATIISAVKQGRGIYANIKKDVQFLLSSNIGEVFTIFVASLMNLFPGFQLGVPLLPIHLLWVNLITDSLPAFAIGMEPVAEDIMDEKPRPKKESFFANRLGFTIAWQGVMIGTITLISYIIGNNISHEIGMTMAFLTLSTSQLVHSFNVKSNKSVLHRTIFNNKYLWGAAILGLTLQLIIVYVPALANIFSLAPLPLEDLAFAMGLSLVPLVVVELAKLLKIVREQNPKS